MFLSNTMFSTRLEVVGKFSKTMWRELSNYGLIVH